MAKKRISKKVRRKRSSNEEETDNSDDDNPDIKVIKNHIYFWCDVTKKTALDLAVKLGAVFSEIRSYSLGEDDITPIYLHINSYGGDTEAALGVVDTMISMKSQGAKIITLIEGNASSAATMISLSGSERRIRPRAFMRVHQFTTGVFGKKMVLDDEHGNLAKLEEILLDFYKEHTDLNKTQLKKLMSRELDFNAKECLDRGFVDSIQY